MNICKNFLQKQQFTPSVFGILFNPFYIIRRNLFKSIEKYSFLLNGVMLDFGCGSKPYKKLFRVKKYIGVDIENTIHNHKNEQIDVFYKGKKLPFKNEFFDSILCSEVLEHIFNPEEILEELYRVLKKGGLGIFTVPFVFNEHEKPHDYARYTSFGIKYLLKKHGFIIKKFEKGTNYIETIFQMWTIYLYFELYTYHKLLRLLIQLFFIAPFTILGLVMSKTLPVRKDFYLNNIILVQKAIRIKKSYNVGTF